MRFSVYTEAWILITVCTIICMYVDVFVVGATVRLQGVKVIEGQDCTCIITLTL